MGNRRHLTGLGRGADTRFMPPFDRSLLQEQDAVLFLKHNNARILEYLTYFTVPMFFFKGNADRSQLLRTDLRETGSGVLVKIGDQHLILTAGHCVQAYSHQRCAFGVEATPHAYVPERWPHGFVHRGSKDYGYIVVPPTEATRFTAGNRAFATDGRILVTDTKTLTLRNDWMILGGYPAELQRQTERGTGARLFVYPTTLAGLGNAPPSDIPVPPGSAEYLDLWVPRFGVDPAQGYREVEVPLLGGASGGGCWQAGVRGSAEPWSTAQLRLSGLHVGSSPNPSPEERFAREVLVGHHLRLVAEEFEPVRKTVYDLWPMLQDDRWAPT